MLIGADGINSRVREILFPNEGPARWNGIMLWRGALDWPAFLTGRSMIVAGGMAAKCVVYPIAEGSRADRRLTNWAVAAKIGDDVDADAAQGGLVAAGPDGRAAAAPARCSGSRSSTCAG